MVSPRACGGRGYDQSRAGVYPTMILLHTALTPEAKPLARHFGLQMSDRRRGPPLLIGDGVSLVVSGAGRGGRRLRMGKSRGGGPTPARRAQHGP